MNIDDLVRSNVRTLKPFSSAREEFTGQADVLLDANESPFVSDCHRYPDPHHQQLRAILADFKDLKKTQIILGNGSDELIDLTVRTFCTPGSDVLRYITPSFGMYEVTGHINDVKNEAISLDIEFDLNVDACLANQTKHHKIIFLCSPNNPTGNLLSEERIVAIIKGWKGVVVLDEAYIEYSRRPSLTSRLDDFPNLIVLQTFSKAIGAAGIRLGMGFSSEKIIQYLNKLKPPYNVNMHTQLKARTLLSQRDIIERRIDLILEERKRMVKELKAIDGIIHVYPSDANFLLVKCQNHKALYDSLCQKGIIVRDRSSLKGCESCLRMTIGLDIENDELLAGIKAFYA